MTQADLFAASAPARPAVIRPGPDTARTKLTELLATLRGADSCPWPDESEARMWRVVSHNMAAWLPEPERSQTREAFAVEFERVGVPG